MAQEKRESRKGRAAWRVFWRVFFSILALLTAIFLYYLLSSLSLSVETLSLETKAVSPVRIVQLTDLHNTQYGERNKKLIALVAAQEPDLIFMCGDMLNRDEENTEIVTSLISALSSTAPVYYGYGNHEKTWEKRCGRSLKPLLEAAGAIVVDNDYVDLDLNGNPLRIGGYMGYYPLPHMTTADKSQQEREQAFFRDFEDTERIKLLIDHIPTGWVDWDYVDNYPVDVVFSGHYHGGVMRIPIIDQGLYAPYVGWFPPFSKGVYSGTQAVCVLSAGLGNDSRFPRVNNPPEIVVIDLIPKTEE